jgi:DNA-binding transcriptional regulator GbsR (MarR family)
MKRQSTLSQVNRLAEKVGTFIEYWGFKRIHGMIWTHLYLSPRPVSAQELIARLKVSKALISLSLKDLQHYGLILQTEDSLNRKNKFYVANPDVFSAIRQVLVTREQELLKKTHEEFHLLNTLAESGVDPKMIATDRLASLGLMIGGAENTLQAILALTEIQPEQLKNMFDVK